MCAASGHGSLALTQSLVLARFVPEREFDPIPESKFVVDDAKMVFYDMLRGANDFGDFAILKSLCYEFDDLLLAWTGDAGSVETSRGHRRARL